LKRKEVTQMKKTISILTIIGFVLAFGIAYAERADSLINTLDPSKVPGFVELETGSVTLAEPIPVFTARGAAAGGMSREPDTFLNYIDPSGVAGYVDPETGAANAESKAFLVRGSAAGGIGMEHDTFLHYIDPSKGPGYMNLEFVTIN
jgi:hypothetical protein